MTLSERLISLAQLTLQDPRQAARALLAERIPLAARTSGLLLVAVISAVLTSLQLGAEVAALDPFTSFMMASPFRAAVFQWLFLALSVVLIFRVGRAFGGQGSLPDALLVVVWLQLLMLVLQVLQLLLSVLSPSLAGIIGLAGFVLFLWLMTSFIAELHGFASLWRVFAVMLATIFATGFLIGLVMILILGPEAFVNV